MLLRSRLCQILISFSWTEELLYSFSRHLTSTFCASGATFCPDGFNIPIGGQQLVISKEFCSYLNERLNQGTRVQACLAVPSFCAALTNISPLSSFSSKAQLPLSTLASAVPPFSPFSLSKSPFSSSSQAKSTNPALQSLFPSHPILVVHPRQIEMELAAFLCQMREHRFFKQKSRPGKNLSFGKRSFWRSWRLQPETIGNHFNKMRW